MGYNKWIGIMLAGMLVLGACQREEAGAPVPGYSTEVIAFTSPYMTTRSTEMRLGSFNEGDQVGVLGYCKAENAGVDISTSPWDTKKYRTKPDVFYNQQLNYGGEGTWNYTWNNEGLHPWYDNEDYTYAFFAYYPFTNLAPSGENGKYTGEIAGGRGTITLSGPEAFDEPVITYTMPHSGGSADARLNWGAVPDFMLAYKVDHLKSDGVVNLSFRHLLCALEFEVNNFNPEPVDITRLAFRGENFYKTVSVTGQESGYSVGEERYSGNFNIISRGGNEIRIPAATVNENEEVVPATVRLEADEAGNLIDLLFITDERGKITAADGSCAILITATMGGEQIGENRHMPINSEMSFRAGVRSIFSINIVGNDFILQIRSDDNWEDGGDSDIVFE